MSHHLHCDLAGSAQRERVVGLRKVTMRERIAKRIFGDSEKFAVIVPGDSIDQITITHKNPDDDLMALAEAVGVTHGGDRA